MENLLSGAHHIYILPQSATILLVVWSANDGSALTSKVNLLTYNTYRWVCATVIASSFGQIEQGAHYIKKFNEESVSGVRSGRASL